MSNIASLMVTLGLDSKAFDKGVDSATKRAGGLASSLSKVGAAAITGGIVAVGAGVAALSAGLVDSVKAASEAADIQAQLDAVLRSTGGAAGVTKNQVNDMADALSKVTKFEHDTIISGENML